MLPSAAVEQYRTLQRLNVAAVGLVRREWARMGLDFDASWRVVGPRLVLVTASAQLGAARAGAGYVPAALEQQRLRVDADAEVLPRGFAGVASDGRELSGLLYSAVTTAKERVGAGADPASALRSGRDALEMYVQTLVADAGRQAASVAIAARPRVGWVRMVSSPCCSRCAILAGQFYRWSSGFQRHPRCQCVHIPTMENVAGDVRTDVDALFAGGHVRDLTAAERKALADGADPTSLVNAKRGAAGMTTTESTTRRGRVRGVRLTPDGIYRRASSRDEALQLLADRGYLQPA